MINVGLHAAVMALYSPVVKLSRGVTMRVLLFWCVWLSSTWLMAVPSAQAGSQELREGWQVSSGCTAPIRASVVSLQGYVPEGWYRASLPATLLAVQLENHTLASSDLFFATNLRNLAGMSYPIGTFFSNQDMPADSPYACGWWYRRAFSVSIRPGTRTWLHFAGINYRANVCVNGINIADSNQVAGAYRTYDFDVTDQLAQSGENVVAVETFAPNANDLGINWVDWNPCPPDKDMGLCGSVSLTTTGAVTVRSPMVTTHFEDVSLESAALGITVEIANSTNTSVTGVLRGEIKGLSAPLSFEQAETLAPQSKDPA